MWEGILGVTWGVLWWLYPPTSSDLILHAQGQSLDGCGVFVIAVLVGTVGLWLTDR